MKQIFLLEDDETLGRGIAMALTGSETSVTCRSTLGKARETLLNERFDLLRQVRSEGDATPVILLTANDLELDEVTGLEAGADDYITKPFSLAVLRARVNAQLRRSTPKVSPTLSVGPFTFDFERMDFRRDGRFVELSKTEQKLLRVLVENRGHAVPRATLVDRVWTDGAEFVEENALSVTVKRLRSKLEADPSKPEYLKTVYGIGYTWAVKL